jgi:hypothetical protein
MLTIILVPNRFAGLLYPTALSAWGYQRHKVVVSVADKLAELLNTIWPQIKRRTCEGPTPIRISLIRIRYIMEYL